MSKIKLLKESEIINYAAKVQANIVLKQKELRIKQHELDKLESELDYLLDINKRVTNEKCL